ncbi:MAG: hypothetical protein ACXIVG_07110 [Pararhodobacter sp.]
MESELRPRGNETDLAAHVARARRHIAGLDVTGLQRLGKARSVGPGLARGNDDEKRGNDADKQDDTHEALNFPAATPAVPSAVWPAPAFACNLIAMTPRAQG